MTDHSGDRWDFVISPWHLDEYIPDFPVPASLTAPIRPALPAAPTAARMSLLHQAVADAVAGASRPPAYLHLDIDVVDSADLPGLRFPSGPGPSLAQIEDCLAAVCATAAAAGAGIACAWLPDRVGDPATREAIIRLTRALGAELSLASTSRM